MKRFGSLLQSNFLVPKRVTNPKLIQKNFQQIFHMSHSKKVIVSTPNAPAAIGPYRYIEFKTELFSISRGAFLGVGVDTT